MQRRELLKTAPVGVLAVSGCIESGNEDSSKPLWSTFRGDGKRRGVRSAETGPGDSLSMSWEFTYEDLYKTIQDAALDEYSVYPRSTSWPVVSETAVYWTMGTRWLDDGEDRGTFAYHVVAVNPGDGSVEWTADVLQEAEFAMDPWFAPELDSEWLYVPYRERNGFGIAVYDSTSGELRERHALALGSMFPYIGQPLVHDGTIYVTERIEDGTNRVRAFDGASGEALWSFEEDVPIRRYPGLSLDEERLWYANRSGDSEIVTRNRSDGSRHEQFAVDVAEHRADDSGLACPTIQDSTGFVGGNRAAMYSGSNTPLQRLDTESFAGEWQYRPTPIDDVGGASDPDGPVSGMYGYSVAVDDLVIGLGRGNGGNDLGYQLIAISETDGSKEWSVEITGIGGYAPVVAGETIYVYTLGGIDMISTTGKRLGRRPVSQDEIYQLYEYVSPAIGHGKLFVPTQSKLVAFE